MVPKSAKMLANRMKKKMIIEIAMGVKIIACQCLWTYCQASPDEKKSKTEAVINLVNSMDIDGVIASNTSDDNHLKSALGVSQKPGGISGKPLKNKSNEFWNQIKDMGGQVTRYEGNCEVEVSKGLQALDLKFK